MATITKTFKNVKISTNKNNPTHTVSINLPPTAHSLSCAMNAHKGTWASMMGVAVLTVAIQKQLDNKSWQNVVQSTFDSRSTGKDGVHAAFGATMAGLEGKNCRVTAWVSRALNGTLDADITVIF